jgi:hypothetical protein
MKNLPYANDSHTHRRLRNRIPEMMPGLTYRIVDIGKSDYQYEIRKHLIGKKVKLQKFYGRWYRGFVDVHVRLMQDCRIPGYRHDYRKGDGMIFFRVKLEKA